MRNIQFNRREELSDLTEGKDISVTEKSRIATALPSIRVLRNAQAGPSRHQNDLPHATPLFTIMIAHHRHSDIQAMLCCEL
jgi:hypothetical protein